MITKKTVFVLGAGASWPFGYPLGRALKEEICNSLDDPNHDLFAKLRDLDFSDHHISKFRDSLRRSGHTSIDAFLGKQTSFIRVGKAAIAHRLICHEIDNRLFDANGLFGGATQNWYELLLERMDCPSLGDWRRNNVAFVTFNYDRSLEHYLFTTLCHRYPNPQDDVIKTLREIPIIHVHGSLGLLPWWDYRATLDKVRDYDATRSLDAIRIAADGIKIICEIGDNDIGEFERAQRELGAAERVFFVGFGYLEENMRRLNVPFNRRGHQHFHGSGFGLTPAERSVLTRKYDGLTLGDPSHRAETFLTHNEIFLEC